MMMILLTTIPVLLMLVMVLFHRRLHPWQQAVMVSAAALCVIWAARFLFWT